MEIDDDDEFGDLYTDVLRPFPVPPPPSASPLPSSAAAADRISQGYPNPSPQPIPSPQILRPSPEDEEEKDDWLLGRAPAAVEPPANWDDDEDNEVPVPDFADKAEPRVLEEENEDELEARVSGSVGGEGIRVAEEEIGDLDQEPVIPGLSSGPLTNGGDLKPSNSEDWDSDSEDDLQIVLNDANHGPMGGERNGEDDDEDGEDLIIVTGEGQHHHHQPMEEQDWSEGELPPATDGDRKEGSEAAAKVNGAVGSVAGPRIGYSNHGFHPQHHSMFKYVRPGTTPITGAPVAGAVGPPGQIRPPPTLGPVGGRGRGDWRPAGIRGIANAQKSFHSGYGFPAWANNSSGRAFGGGLDFTLPSHKTVFDVDIESFDEKPWRHPGVDTSDYFNFGLDEENWKDYCRQLDQLRLESTMQSKIRVYESGRSEHDYDPDLPPELAAATGHHDISADAMHHGKTDNGQTDLNGQGRGTPCIRPPLPTGRAIQVESGYGERLPSIDTRPPRTRDADAIIEIVLQDSMDDSSVHNGVVEQPEKHVQGEQLKVVHDVEGDRHGDGILPFPSESPLQCHPSSRLRSPANSGGSFGAHRGGRSMQGASRGRYSSTSGDHLDDAIPRSAQVKKHQSHGKERPADSREHSETPEGPAAVAAETARELSIEQKDGEHDDRLALGDSVEVEGEETSDIRISGETVGDDSIVHSLKKQKLSSRVEQPTTLDNGDDDELRRTHSDNSIAKSGSSKEYQKRRESGEEVIQDGHSRRTTDLRRRHDEEEHNFRRKDDYGREGRYEIDRNRMGSKGREAIYHSNPQRDWESNMAQPVRGRSEGFDRPRETDGSLWQRREDDSYSRRVKDEDIRRERHEDIGSKNKIKVRASDMSDRDDDIHPKKRVDDGDWRGHSRDGGLRQRERDDMLMSHRDNLDDHQLKRKKDEEHSRRERAAKEDSLHGYRTKEDSSRRKREREDGAEHRRREDTTRVRDKPEDHHLSKHKDESWRQREREDRQRLKQPHEDSLTNREREGRGAPRSGRGIEDKPLGGRTKNDLKGIVSDKDYQHRDRRRHDELSKRGDRLGEQYDPPFKGREDVHAREKHYNNEERSSRHERLSTRNDRPSSASDSQQISRDRHRDSTRKSRDIEGNGPNLQGLGKRRHEDHSTHRGEKVSSKGTNERGSNSALFSKKSHQLPHSSEKQGEEDIVSDDENQEESRRGRSKLERWTSHQERDYTVAKNIQASSSLRAKEIEGTDVDMIPADNIPKAECNDSSDPEPKVSDAGQNADKSGDDRDRHLDTVAKLKRRSERFKLPMPGEKETTAVKKAENELQPTQNEAVADSEVRPERPARKRRWTSS